MFLILVLRCFVCVFESPYRKELRKRILYLLFLSYLFYNILSDLQHVNLYIFTYFFFFFLGISLEVKLIPDPCCLYLERKTVPALFFFFFFSIARKKLFFSFLILKFK